MWQTSFIEISKSALENNYNFLREMMPGVRISSVVKGNAYGHGIEHFVPLAEACGIDHFSVFSANEAMRVMHSAKSRPDIMIMGMIDDHELLWAIENNISFFVFNWERLKLAQEIALKAGLQARVHIEAETGMNRTGFAFNELNECFKFLSRNRNSVVFEGFCTHFAGAESIANYYRISHQIQVFEKGIEKLKKRGMAPRNFHAACSAAAVRFPNIRYQLVRIGIMQYGFWPSREVFVDYSSKMENKYDPLKRLISWKSKIMSLKNVKANEFIGYGTSFLAQNDMKIAIVPVGYAHGFARSLSNSGRAIINGHRVGVVGTVNMNALTLDVTHLESVNLGDEVVLIGEQGNVDISVSSFSELSDQLNYELLVRLPHDIPRNITD
ncbi:alanine racemase [bacterium]|nr:alanine racemase [bacterium]